MDAQPMPPTNACCVAREIVARMHRTRALHAMDTLRTIRRAKTVEVARRLAEQAVLLDDALVFAINLDDVPVVNDPLANGTARV